MEHEHYFTVSEIVKDSKSGNNLPATDELAGQKFKFYFNLDNLVIDYNLHDTGSLTWAILSGPDKGSSGTEKYEAKRVDNQVYFLDYIRKDRPDTSVSMALDLNTGRATVVMAISADRNSALRGFQERLEKGIDLSPMKVRFLSANVNPDSPDRPVIPHEKTTDLLGKRIRYIYRKDAIVEHIYINPRFYTWHSVKGPEEGLAATDRCEYFKISPDVYFFVWWEHIVPAIGAVIINLKEMRSTGKVFGPDFNIGEHKNKTMGAYAELVSEIKPD
jgi:hypothetical protein